MANQKITPELFTAIKLLLNRGATNAQVKELFDVSTKTSGRIREADDFAGYKRICDAIVEDAREKRNALKAKAVTPAPVAPTVVEHKQTVTVQATWAMMQEMQKTNELLTSISNKLAYIVEQLT